MSAQVVPFTPYEPVPTAAEKAVWDRFVEEYMKDFNPVEANLRVGFMIQYAVEYAKVFMSKPYVQRRITEEKNKAVAVNEDDKDKVRALCIATYKECMQNGQPQTRVAAARALASLYGLDLAPDRSAEDLERLVNSFKEIAKAAPD